MIKLIHVLISRFLCNFSTISKTIEIACYLIHWQNANLLTIDISDRSVIHEARCFGAIRSLSPFPVSQTTLTHYWLKNISYYLLAGSLACRSQISLGAIALNHCLAFGRNKIRAVRSNHLLVDVLYRRLSGLEWQITGNIQRAEYSTGGGFRNIAKQQRLIRERYKAIKYLHGTVDLKKFNSPDFSNNRTVENISIEVGLYSGKNTRTFFFIGLVSKLRFQLWSKITCSRSRQQYCKEQRVEGGEANWHSNGRLALSSTRNMRVFRGRGSRVGSVLETFGLPDIADQRVVAPYFAILKHP